jgi:serine/threonine protein phosphatase 1
MLNSLKKLFRAPVERALPAIPPGQRVYAIGDIHGRLDLLVELAEAIEADDAARGPAKTTIIMLGDLVDRGPDSAGVITAARIWASQRNVRIITGNHEEMFLKAFDNSDVLRHFLRSGGKETLLSYPVDADDYFAAELYEVQEMMVRAVPEEDLEFIRSFEDTIAIGDYVFVHAGIVPDVALEDQSTGKLRWIREPFLSHDQDYGFVVIHGHTITDEPEVRPNRIGIDTGAYESGRLTALGLDETQRWFIEAQDKDGTISTEIRSAA